MAIENPTQRFLIPTPEIHQPQDVAWTLLIRIKPENLEVLVAEKADGSLTFPGGKIEPGEYPFEAAIRELQEETALRLDPSELFIAGPPQSQFTTQGKFIHTYPYFAFWGSVHTQLIHTPEPDKNSSWKWISFRELIKSIYTSKLIPSFDTNCLAYITEIIFEAEYNHQDASVEILEDCADYRYLSDLLEYQRKIFGSSYTNDYN